MKKRYVLSRIAIVLAGLLVGLFCIEAILRASIALGTDPMYLAQEGPDANGFRNEAIPDRVDIVAIGDSQTWGINARRAQAWPQMLARLSGQSTYNMGLGGNGPVEYWVLTDKALRLSPKVVVIGLYFGNDIWDAYYTVYHHDTYPFLRNNQVDNELLRDTVLPQVIDVEGEQKEHGTWLERSIFANFGHELNLRSVAFRLLWRSWVTLSDSQYKSAEAWAQANPDEGAIYKQGGTNYILEPGYRLPALDLDNPVIVEGLRITKQMLLFIQNKTNAADANLILLLIPTQEMVYADVIETSNGYLSPTYNRLVQMETRIRTEIISLCDEKGIHYVDALPALIEALRRGEVIYPRYINGHPRAEGYSVIASTLNEALKSLGWFE